MFKWKQWVSNFIHPELRGGVYLKEAKWSHESSWECLSRLSQEKSCRILGSVKYHQGSNERMIEKILNISFWVSCATWCHGLWLNFLISNFVTECSPHTAVSSGTVFVRMSPFSLTPGWGRPLRSDECCCCPKWRKLDKWHQPLPLKLSSPLPLCIANWLEANELYRSNKTLKGNFCSKDIYTHQL